MEAAGIEPAQDFRRRHDTASPPTPEPGPAEPPCPPPVTKSRDRTSAYPATEPTAASATLTSTIVLKPVTNAWCAAFTTLSRSAGGTACKARPGRRHHRSRKLVERATTRTCLSADEIDLKGWHYRQRTWAQSTALEPR